MRRLHSGLTVWAGFLLGMNAYAQPMEAFLRAPAAEEVVYAIRDGQRLLLHAFRPGPRRGEQGRAAILWIHGGAWVGGTPAGFMPHARYFAARGMVAVSLTYRLTRPEGPTVADAVSDCREAVRFVRRHATEWGIDPTRIAVAGDSAGGHLAASLATLPVPSGEEFEAGRPNALLLYNPVLDLTEGDWIRYAVGGVALADKHSPRPESPLALARARALSPIFHLAAGQPPTLLLHGTSDRIVPLSQAERYAAVSANAGNRCDFIRVPDVGHAFVIAAYKWPEPVVVEAIRVADRFLASLGWLEGKPTLTVSATPAWIPLPR